MRRIIIVQNSVKTTLIFRKHYIEKLLEKNQVYLIAPNDCDESKMKLETLGVVIYSLPKLSNKTNLVKYWFLSNLLVIKHRYHGDTFICHFLVTLLIHFLFIIPFNRRLIIYTEGLGSIFSSNRFARGTIKKILHLSSGKRLFCNNEERLLLGSPNDIVTGGIGVDFNLFPFKKFKPKFLEANSPLKILYIGRLIEDKGTMDVICLLRKLLEKGIDVQLTLVGDVYPNNPTSLTLEDIERFKDEFGMMIRFEGFQKSVVKYYHESDLLVLPSVREGFPVCVMEANSCGLPVIGYDVPGVRDAIENNINGKLVPLKSIDQLVIEITNMIDDDTMLRLNHQSRIYANNNFDVEDKSKFLVNLLIGL
ncbi:glycosyltransferase [Vibrio chagasii]|uniref:glycosyltransferase n=1 Tax=Vibrio chagasii TaxID=170679 RepID=UPI0035A5E166